MQFNDEVFSSIEQFLRMGERGNARTQLDQILNSKVKISRNKLVKFCELLRRAGKSDESIKYLHKYVRRKSKNFKKPTVQEIEEYAGALINLKLLEEAQGLLKEAVPFRSPKTFFFLGLAAVNEWNYEAGEKYFEEFLSFQSNSQYDYYIGIVNLVACQIFLVDSIHGKIEKILDKIEVYLKETKELNFKILHANLLELKTQLIVRVSNTKLPKNILLAAREIINDSKSKENLFIEKWNLLSIKPHSTDYKKKELDLWIKKILELRNKANEIGHIETVRDIDFYLGNYDENVLERVYFGTPYETFRNRIIKEYPNFTIQDSFWHEIGSGMKVKEFDYLQYKELTKSSKILKTLQALTSDFYRLQNKYSLFGLIFPGEFFNSEVSFNKVYVTITRTRNWLKRKHIPLQILEKNGEYYLEGQIHIKLYLQDLLKDQEELIEPRLYAELDQLRKKFNHSQFSIRDASETLKHENLRKTQRLLKKAFENKLIARELHSKNTTYSLLPKRE